MPEFEGASVELAKTEGMEVGGFGFGSLVDGSFIGEVKGPDGIFSGMVDDLGGGRYKISNFDTGEESEIGGGQAAQMAGEIPEITEAPDVLQQAEKPVSAEELPSVPEAVEVSSFAEAPEDKAAMESKPAAETKVKKAISLERRKTMRKLKELRSRVGGRVRVLEEELAGGGKKGVVKRAESLERKTESDFDEFEEKRRKGLDLDRFVAKAARLGAEQREAKKLRAKAEEMSDFGSVGKRKIDSYRMSLVGVNHELNRWENIIQHPEIVDRYKELKANFEAHRAEVDEAGEQIRRYERYLSENVGRNREYAEDVIGRNEQRLAELGGDEIQDLERDVLPREYLEKYKRVFPMDKQESAIPPSAEEAQYRDLLPQLFSLLEEKEAQPTPIDLGTTEEELEAEKARRRAEMAETEAVMEEAPAPPEIAPELEIPKMEEPSAAMLEERPSEAAEAVLDAAAIPEAESLVEETTLETPEITEADFDRLNDEALAAYDLLKKAGNKKEGVERVSGVLKSLAQLSKAGEKGADMASKYYDSLTSWNRGIVEEAIKSEELCGGFVRDGKIDEEKLREKNKGGMILMLIEFLMSVGLGSLDLGVGVTVQQIKETLGK